MTPRIRATSKRSSPSEGSLKGEDIDAIKAKQEDLTKKFYDVSAKVYQANAPQDGAAPAGDNGSTPPPSDDGGYYNGEVH